MTVECRYHAPLEPEWLDDTDDGNWTAVNILSRRKLTARIEHKCDGFMFDDDRKCRKPILPGQRYERQFWLYEDGSTIEMKKHVGCYHRT